MYSGYLLSEKSRKKLEILYPPKFSKFLGHHITEEFGVKGDSNPPAKPTDVQVVGYACDDKIEGFLVKVDGNSNRPSGGLYHITWSLDPDKAKPVNTNDIIAGAATIHPVSLDVEPKVFTKSTEAYLKESQPNDPMPYSKFSQLQLEIAKVAQGVYDEWDENEDEYAGGGICHLIADEICNLLSTKNIECTSVNTQIGENHVFVVAKIPGKGIYSIDIPPYVYETGGGYNWKKIPDVEFEASDVGIDLLDSDEDSFENYISESLSLDSETVKKILKARDAKPELTGDAYSLIKFLNN